MSKADRFVISHTGKKGGPWELDGGTWGDGTGHAGARWVSVRKTLERWLPAIRERHPNAKILELAPRSRKVVRRAIAFVMAVELSKSGAPESRERKNQRIQERYEDLARVVAKFVNEEIGR